MSKLATGENLDHAVDDQQRGPVVSVFPTVDGNFRYFFDMDRQAPLQPAEESIVPLPANLM